MLKTGVIIMALFSFLQANWFTDLFDDTPKPPIYVPIDMSKAGKVADFIIRSDDSEKYRVFSLYFATRVDGKYYFHWNSWIYKFLGHCPRYATEPQCYNMKGTVTPVKLTVYRLEKAKEPKLLFDKTKYTCGIEGGLFKINGQKGRYEERSLLMTELPKGKYRIKLENLKSFPELKKIETYFAIHGTHKI